jgi:hypothetical protein
LLTHDRFAALRVAVHRAGAGARFVLTLPLTVLTLGDRRNPPLVIVHGLRDHSHSFDDLARGLLEPELLRLHRSASVPSGFARTIA